MNRKTDVVDFEELKNIVKNYRVSVIEEPAMFELFRRKFGWKVETIPIVPSLKPKWKQKLFIYFILFHGFQGKDVRKWSLKAFLPLPRGVVMPAIGLSADKTHLHFLFLNYPSPNLTLRPYKSMRETIDEGRRVTMANILRWAQQLFRFLLYIHRNYITINGNLHLDQVLLQQDTEPFHQMKEWLQIDQILKKKYKCKEEDLKKIPRVEHVGRQVWIDFFTAPQKTEFVFTANRSYSPERSSSPSSPRRGEASIEETMHLFTDLRNLDHDLTWKLSHRAIINQEKEDYYTNLFLKYSQAYQQDLRALGIIILQLLKRQVFIEKELKYWLSWNPPLDDIPEYHPAEYPLSNVMKSSPERISHVKSSDMGDAESVKSHQSHHSKDGSISVLSQSVGETANSSSAGQREKAQSESQISQITDLDVLANIEKRLSIELADMTNVPEDLRSLLSICFAPVTYPFHSLNHSKLHFTLLMRLPYIKILRDLVEGIEETVTEQENDKHYVKESFWTEEDEEKRIKAKKDHKKEMKKKAVEGVKNAAERVRQEKQMMWWSLQSTEFKIVTRKKRKARLLTDSRFKERRDLIYKALFHRWDSITLQSWIHKAIRNYYDLISKYRDEVEKNKPKKPEVYINRIISEVFTPFDNFLLTKVLGKYSYLYDEEEKQRLLKEARDREKAIEKSAFLRLTGGKKTKSTAPKSNTLTQSSNTSKSPTNNLSSSMPVLGDVAGPSLRSSVFEGENPSDQNDQTSILSKSISEKIDFCYRAISSQYAKIFAQSSSSLLLSKGIRKAIKSEKEESLSLIGKTLIISEEQHFYKQLFLQTKYLMQDFPDMKYTVSIFFQGMQIIDRQRMKALMTVLSQAILYQYHQDEPIRLKGDNVAACRITAFFRMIYTNRVILPKKIEELKERSNQLKEALAEKARLALVAEQLMEEEKKKKSETVHSIFDSFKTLPPHLQPPPPENPIQLRSLKALGNTIKCSLRLILFPMTADVRELIDQQQMLAAAASEQGKRKKRISFDNYDFKKAFSDDRRQHLYDDWNELTPIAYRITSHVPSSPVASSSSLFDAKETPAKEEIVIYLKHSKQIYREQYLKKKDFYEEQMNLPSTPSGVAKDISSPVSRQRRAKPFQIRKYPVQMKTIPCISKMNPQNYQEEIVSASLENSQDHEKYANVMDIELEVENLPTLTSFQLSFEVSSDLTKDLYEYHQPFFALYTPKDDNNSETENKDKDKEVEKKVQDPSLITFKSILCENKEQRLSYDVSLSQVDPQGIHLNLHKNIRTRPIAPSTMQQMKVALVYYSSYLHTIVQPGTFPRYLPLTNQVVKGEAEGELSLPSSDIIQYERINQFENRPYEWYYDIGAQYHVIQQFSALIQLYFLESLDDKKENTHYDIQRRFVILLKREETEEERRAREEKLIQENPVEVVEERELSEGEFGLEETQRAQKRLPVLDILYEGEWKDVNTNINTANPPYPIELIEHQLHPQTQETMNILTNFDYFTTDIFEEEKDSVPLIINFISENLTDIIYRSALLQASSTSSQAPHRLAGLVHSSLEFGFIYRIRVKNSIGVSKYMKLDYSHHSILLGKIMISEESLMKRGKLVKTLQVKKLGLSSTFPSNQENNYHSSEVVPKVLIPNRKANPLIMKQLLQHSQSASNIQTDSRPMTHQLDPLPLSKPTSAAHSLPPISFDHPYSPSSPTLSNYSRKHSPIMSRSQSGRISPSPSLSPTLSRSRSPSSRKKSRKQRSRPSTQQSIKEVEIDPQQQWLKALQMTSPLVINPFNQNDK